MKNIPTAMHQQQCKVPMQSRKLMIGMAIACALWSTACSKEKEEVQPVSQELEQVSKDFTAIKAVTVQIPSLTGEAAGTGE